MIDFARRWENKQNYLDFLLFEGEDIGVYNVLNYTQYDFPDIEGIGLDLYQYLYSSLTYDSLLVYISNYLQQFYIVYSSIDVDYDNINGKIKIDIDSGNDIIKYPEILLNK